MENHLIKLQYTVARMLALLENISKNSDQFIGKTEQKIYFKHDVMQVLKISESTYKRYVKSKKLKPELIGGIHIYTAESLKAIIDELRRRGRL